jgi:hypothetical protein
VSGPAGGGAIDGVKATESAASDNCFYGFVMLAVTVLVADNRFDTALIECLPNLQAFGAGHRDWLFEGDQFRAAFDAKFNEIEAQIGERAKTKEIGLEVLGERSGIGSDCGIADFWSGGFQARFINIANANDFEARIGMEGGGVVKAAFAHPDDHDTVLVHN